MASESKALPRGLGIWYNNREYFDPCSIPASAMNEHAFSAPPPEAVLDRLAPIVRETVIVEGRSYLIDHPGEADRLAKHPAVREAFARDAYMPYWADLWPASRMLAKAILREPWTAGTEALEIGCGLGLPGIVALSLGLRVTLSDYDACALRFAASNARLNGCDGFGTLQLDWRAPPDDVKVPLLLAADLLYEQRSVAPLLACIKKLLAPGGVCLLTDVERVPAEVLKETLHAEGMPFTTKLMRAGEPGGRREKGTLYRITH